MRDTDPARARHCWASAPCQRHAHTLWSCRREGGEAWRSRAEAGGVPRTSTQHIHARRGSQDMLTAARRHHHPTLRACHLHHPCCGERPYRPDRQYHHSTRAFDSAQLSRQVARRTIDAAAGCQEVRVDHVSSPAKWLALAVTSWRAGSLDISDPVIAARERSFAG